MSFCDSRGQDERKAHRSRDQPVDPTARLQRVERLRRELDVRTDPHFAIAGPKEQDVRAPTEMEDGNGPPARLQPDRASADGERGRDLRVGVGRSRRSEDEGDDGEGEEEGYLGSQTGFG